MINRNLVIWSTLLAGGLYAQSERNLDTVKSMAGCFLVDYSYSENEVLDDDYILDPRVYDASKYIVKELVKVVDEGENSVRLQHFMQADSFEGDVIFMMRHHGEIWDRRPEYRYKYEGRYGVNDRWSVENLDLGGEYWVRSVTSLDDGLRYQCLGGWKADTLFPEFECHAFSPIPGRETRDMARTDYNTMDRSTRVILYNDSWLERQSNTKVLFSKEESKELVREVGKIWSVRLPDEECATVSAWADEKQAFWDILADVWKQSYDGVRPFNEIKFVDGTTRSQKISAITDQYAGSVANNPADTDIVRQKLAEIIEAHRE